ncbi:MAG: hypothetical protein HYR70_02265 [Chloroflexi bacterium]|nr:hypothetical protein [Chloroflexota bacterium]MBI1855187.1 hypothetical protein [Chloroflexota bacterium]MBI3340985.1 hypothetical protein [Chloroflexota bacterium]
MKKFLILALALIVTGCAPAAPTALPAAVIPPTPVVVVATVLVPVVQTQIVQPTAAPTEAPANTPVPQPTQEPPTAAPANTSAPSSGAGTATATLPADAGGNLFTNLTRSGSYFNLRCLPQDITFSVSTTNYAVAEVDFWYRFEDLTTQPITYSEWKNLGKMTSDKNGNFTINFNTMQINPDLRAADKAWIDYQFVGVSKTGDAVGRSGKISQQILYLKNCP